LLLLLPLMAGTASAFESCQDKGPWPCEEDGCPSPMINCSQLKGWCTSKFSHVWDKPPTGFDQHLVWQQCPVTCKACDRVGYNSRIYQFYRVFAFVSVCLGLAVLVLFKYGEQLSGVQEQAGAMLTRALNAMTASLPALKPIAPALTTQNLARAFIATYFLFEAPLSWRAWSIRRLGLRPITDALGAVASVTCVLGVRPLLSASLMMLDIALDAYQVLSGILANYSAGRGIYINELMAKKISLLGCGAMLVAVSLQRSQKKVFTGLLMDSETISNSTSLALLAGRLLIAFLFAYVGLSELHRLGWEFSPYSQGDPHDTIWPKCVELLLVLPFSLGFRTYAVSRSLAASLFLEAATAWSWRGYNFRTLQWREHHREHFATNLAVSGGLLLLQSLGGGRFTVDEMLKKRD